MSFWILDYFPRWKRVYIKHFRVLNCTFDKLGQSFNSLEQWMRASLYMSLLALGSLIFIFYFAIPVNENVKICMYLLAISTCLL